MTATESVVGAVLPDKRAYVRLSCIWRIVIVGEEDVNVFLPFMTCSEKLKYRSVELQKILLMHLSISHPEDRFF